MLLYRTTWTDRRTDVGSLSYFSEIYHSICPKSLYFAIPLAFKLPTDPETNFVKFFVDVKGWHLQKI